MFGVVVAVTSDIDVSDFGLSTLASIRTIVFVLFQPITGVQIRLLGAVCDGGEVTDTKVMDSDISVRTTDGGFAPHRVGFITRLRAGVFASYSL